VALDRELVVVVAALHLLGAAHQALQRQRDRVGHEHAGEQRDHGGDEAEQQQRLLHAAQVRGLGVERALQHVHLPGLRSDPGIGAAIVR
jgi:hypothetical protein